MAASEPPARPDRGVAPAAVPVITRAWGRERTVGVVVTRGDTVTWVPTVDRERVAVHALAVVAALGLGAAAAVAARPRPTVQAITMGPGGWVSLRGVRTRAGLRSVTARGLRRRPADLRGRPAAPRPWWAWLLRARPVDSLRYRAR